MNQPPIDSINAALKEKCRKNGEACDWLAGLNFSWQGTTLLVSFLHPLFGKWFKTAKLEIFADLLRDALGKNVSWEMAENSATPPWPEAAPGQADFSEIALEDFLDSGQNRLAIACAKSIAENADAPAIAVFCGEPASGKTLLLTALASALAGKRAVMAKTRIFLANSPYLAQIYAGYFWDIHSALLLDDLQGIADSTPLQAKLAEIMDYAAARENSRMVFAWQGAAAGMARLSPSLRHRLEKGAIFFLQKPDLATKLQYIEKTARELGLPLKKETILYLARQARDLPAMHGFLEKIRVFRASFRKLPDEDELAQLLESQATAQRLGWKDILDKVCAKLRIDPQLALEDSRKPDILLGRQVAMYLCRTRLGLSFTELGKIFGGKDHSTVMHSVSKIEKLKDTHKVTRDLLTELEKSL